MNKLILIIAIALVGLGAKAATSTMLFKTSDDKTHAIASAGLEIKFVDGNMIATTPSQTLSLDAATLVSMEFSGESSATAIIADYTGQVTVTDIKGTDAGTYRSIDDAQRQLAPGIYIVKPQNGETIKLIIRK